LAKTFVLFTGKSKDEAMSDYITKVKQLLEEAAAGSS
jgi:diazepam-binding inhibitor (GABA receptor modulator, acyl-CoA-binding protein)